MTLASGLVLAVLSVWDYPSRQHRHEELRGEFIRASANADYSACEKAARAGTELLPDDPTWRYNLACALAYRESPSAALDSLEQAVRLGFRNANAIEKDNDFARVNSLPRFKEIVALAQKLAGEPIPGRPEIGPAYGHIGSTLTLSPTNVSWNFDAGVFETEIKLAGEHNAAPLAGQYGKSRPTQNGTSSVSDSLRPLSLRVPDGGGNEGTGGEP